MCGWQSSQVRDFRGRLFREGMVLFRVPFKGILLKLRFRRRGAGLKIRHEVGWLKFRHEAGSKIRHEVEEREKGTVRIQLRFLRLPGRGS